MDTLFWVIRVILLACFMTLVITAVAFSFSKSIISGMAVNLKPEEFTYFVVAALGGATAIGLQLHGRWFNEKSHLYEQWAKGIELLSSEEESKVLRGIEILAEIGGRAKWSYKYRAIDTLLNCIRVRAEYEPSVQVNVLKAVSSLLVLRRKLFWNLFGALGAIGNRGIIDLTGIHFVVPVNMAGLVFSRKVYLDDSIFDKGVEFGGSIFLGGISARGCHFGAEVTFSEGKFFGIFNMVRCIFEERVDFNKASLGGEFVSEGQVFNGAVDFSEAYFWKDARFLPCADGWGGEFYGTAKFQGVKFFRDVSFGKVGGVASSQSGASIFHSTVHFGESRFHGDAFFKGVTFRQGASFGLPRRRLSDKEGSSAACFYGVADFSDVDFGLSASQGVRKRNVTDFKGALFRGPATFKGVNDLSLDALLKDAIFLDSSSPFRE